MATNTGPEFPQDDVTDWLRFLRNDSHILRDQPHLLFQQATNQPDSTAPAKAAQEREVKGLERLPWFRWVNKNQQRPTYRITLIGHTSSVYSCSISPNGNRIASAGWDGVRIWSTRTGREIGDPIIENPTSYVAFTHDGLWIDRAEGPRDRHRLELLEDATWRVIRAIDVGGDSRRAVSLSRDGKWLAVIETGRVEIFDAKSLSLLREIHLPGTDKPYFSAGAFSGDSRFFMAMEFSGRAGRWDTANWKPEIVGDTEIKDAHCFDLSPDGERAAFVRRDCIICCTLNPLEVYAEIGEHSFPIEGCSFSPDGQLLASCGRDGRMIIQEYPQARSDRSAVVPKNYKNWMTRPSGYQLAEQADGQISACAFSPDGGSVILLAYPDGARLVSGHSLDSVETGFDNNHIAHSHYTSCAVSPDNRHVVCGRKSGTVAIHGLINDDPERNILSHPHTLAVTDVAFSADGAHILSTSQDRSFKLWDGIEGRLVRTERTHNASVNAGAFSPDGSVIVTASSDNTVRIWRADSGEEIGVIDHGEPVLSVAFADSGERIFSATSGGVFSVHEVPGMLTSTVSKPGIHRVSGSRASLRDNQVLLRAWWMPSAACALAVFRSGQINIVRMATGEPVATYITGSHATACALSHDARRLVLATLRGVLLLRIEGLSLAIGRLAAERG